MCGFKKSRLMEKQICLTSESVQGTSLSLQSVDDVHGSDGLSLGVLGVGHSISDHVLQEDLEDSSGLFVDETADTFHTTSTSQSTDSGFGDTLDVITQNFSMTLGASLSQSFSSFASSRHLDLSKIRQRVTTTRSYKYRLMNRSALQALHDWKSADPRGDAPESQSETSYVDC